MSSALPSNVPKIQLENDSALGLTLLTCLLDLHRRLLEDQDLQAFSTGRPQHRDPTPGVRGVSWCRNTWRK